MELHSPDYIDLNGKVVLLKSVSEASESISTDIQTRNSIVFRLRRVCSSCSPVDINVRLTRVVPKYGAVIIETLNRNLIEGWLTDVDAERLLMWETLRS